MDLDELARNDWIRAATLAQMVLCQALSDEALDALVDPTATETVPAQRAA
jgi:hypothetical protein